MKRKKTEQRKTKSFIAPDHSSSVIAGSWGIRSKAKGIVQQTINFHVLMLMSLHTCMCLEHGEDHLKDVPSTNSHPKFRYNLHGFLLA